MINEFHLPVQTNNDLLLVIKGLLVDPSWLRRSFVTRQNIFNKNHKEESGPMWKTECLYYMEFWRGAFNELPIIISYSHFTWLIHRDVEKLIFRELLVQGSSYYFDHKAKKVNKLLECM